MGFRGWPAEAVEFFEGLEADNSKTYWTANKDLYERCVKAPMNDLLTELSGEFGEGKVFRPYRDVRFSKNKTPYKTNIAATLSAGGYISLDAHSFGVGSGMYVMAPDQLQRFRAAIDAEPSGTELERLVASLRRTGAEVASHDRLKTAPKGYAKDHPRIELLCHKGLIAWRDWPIGAWLGTSEAKKRVREFLRAARPLNDWLGSHVGDSTMPAEA